MKTSGIAIIFYHDYTSLPPILSIRFWVMFSPPFAEKKSPGHIRPGKR